MTKGGYGGCMVDMSWTCLEGATQVNGIFYVCFKSTTYRLDSSSEKLCRRLTSRKINVSALPHNNPGEPSRNRIIYRSNF